MNLIVSQKCCVKNIVIDCVVLLTTMPADTGIFLAGNTLKDLFFKREGRKEGIFIVIVQL